MTAQSRALLDAALALNDLERAWLAERLLESLGPDDETSGGDLLDEDAFAAEIERRCQEVREGKVELIPWSEVEVWPAPPD
jgi:putative addiction module component (TIGR02574 family)